MSIRRRALAGFSLIELIMAIVLIGLGLAGLLVAFSSAARHGADPMVHKQMLAVAEEMMEEILLKPYAATANAATGVCARDTWNDILDYNGYDTSTTTCVSGGPAAATATIYDMSGMAIPALSGYSVSISISDAVLPGSGAVPAKKILITVSHGAGDRIQLTAWRTNYAA